jgi:hypothetical protein
MGRAHRIVSPFFEVNIQAPQPAASILIFVFWLQRPKTCIHLGARCYNTVEFVLHFHSNALYLS